MTADTHTRAREFRDQLARRVLVADGAMGTMLYSRGVFINRCFDELNLSAPDLVREIHQEYVKAGRGDPRDQHLRRQPHAPGRLRHGGEAAGDQPRRGAAWRARPRATPPSWPAPSARSGVHIEPLGPTSFAEAREVFREQADGAGRSRRRPADPRDLLQPRRTARGHLRRARGRRAGSRHRGAGHHRRLRASCPTARTPRPSRASSTSGPPT